MNAARRKLLDQAERLFTEGQNLCEQAQATIEAVKDEELEAHDNLPEGIQNSERGETMMACVEAMDEALSTLEQLTDVNFDAMRGDS